MPREAREGEAGGTEGCSDADHAVFILSLSFDVWTPSCESIVSARTMHN